MCLKRMLGRLKARHTREPKVLLRYTTLENLVRMFELKGIPLYDGSKWLDKCDYAFVQRGKHEIGADRVGILPCMAPDLADRKERVWETSAHWDCYTRPREEKDALGNLGVCIQFNAAELIGQLKGQQAICRRVQYLKYEQYKDCESWGKNAPESWFFTKRNAFQWEQEYRIVVIDQPEAEIRDAATAFIPVADMSNVVRNVVISPFCKEKVGDVRGEIRNYAQDRLSETEMKAMLDKVSYCCKIFDYDDILNMAEVPERPA